MISPEKLMIWWPLFQNHSCITRSQTKDKIEPQYSSCELKLVLIIDSYVEAGVYLGSGLMGPLYASPEGFLFSCQFDSIHVLIGHIPRHEKVTSNY